MMTEKSLAERTVDRLRNDMDEMLKNFHNPQFWIDRHGGQENHDRMLKLAGQAVEASDRRNRFEQLISRIASGEVTFPNSDILSLAHHAAVAWENWNSHTNYALQLQHAVQPYLNSFKFDPVVLELIEHGVPQFLKMEKRRADGTAPHPNASFLCGGPGDDVEQWGRDIAVGASEHTLYLEKEARFKAGIGVVNGIGWGMTRQDCNKYVGQEVEIIKQCKSGLYQVRAKDGKVMSLAKSSLI